MKKDNKNRNSSLSKVERTSLQFLKDVSLTISTDPIKFAQPIQMIWKPKEDITAYELALCIPYSIRFNNIMPYEVDQSLPHFRHFEIIDPNK